MDSTKLLDAFFDLVVVIAFAVALIIAIKKIINRNKETK